MLLLRSNSTREGGSGGIGGYMLLLPTMSVDRRLSAVRSGRGPSRLLDGKIN